MADDLTPPELVDELRMAIYRDTNENVMRVVILRNKTHIVSADAHTVDVAIMAAARGAATELERERHGRP